MDRRWTEDPMVIDDDKNDLEEVKTLKVSWFFVGITK